MQKKYRILDFYDDLDDKLLSPLLKSASLPEKDKTKLQDSDFALIVRYPNGVIHRHYPIHDEQNVNLSIDYFLKTANKLSPKEKYVASYYLSKAANAFGINVPGYIENILLGNPFEVENNIVDLTEEPEEEGEEKDFLLPNAKMLPVTSGNINDYIKNFEKIAQHLEQEQQEEAAFNIIRIMSKSGKKKITLPNKIVKLAQAYSQRLLEKERNKKKVQVSGELKKLAASLPYEWHKLSTNQKYIIANLLNKAASEYDGFNLGDVEQTLISDYLDHSLNPRLLSYNLRTRGDRLLDAYSTSKNYDPDISVDLLKAKLVDIGRKALNLYKSASYSREDVLKLIKELHDWDRRAGFEDRYAEFYIDDPYVTFSSKGYSSYLKGALPEPAKSEEIAKIASARDYPFAPDYSAIRDALFEPVGPYIRSKPVVIGISKVASRKADPITTILRDIFDFFDF